MLAYSNKFLKLCFSETSSIHVAVSQEGKSQNGNESHVYHTMAFMISYMKCA